MFMGHTIRRIYNVKRQPRALKTMADGASWAGKSVIASVLMQDLLQNFETQHDTVLVPFLLCRRDNEKQQMAADFIAGLLRQVLQCSHAREPMQAIRDYYDNSSTSSPVLSDLMKTFEKIVVSYDRIYIVLDGLDEYGEDNSIRTELLKRLMQDDIRLLVTSRFLPIFQAVFESAARLNIKAQDHDLKTYIGSRIEDTPTIHKRVARANGESLRREISSIVFDKTAGR